VVSDALPPSVRPEVAAMLQSITLAHLPPALFADAQGSASTPTLTP
jgi:hypothetical protein